MMPELREVLPLDGYPPEIGAALWRLEDARDRMLRLLDDLPADMIDRDVGGNSIGTILYHMALIETDWLFAEILEEPYPEDIQMLLPADHRDKSGNLTVIQGESLAQHLVRLDSIRRTLLDRLQGLTAEDFHRPRSFPQYDVSPAWVLHHLTLHEAEHRGEIGAIMSFLSGR
jgi:uncharacterized damage-inducible protein DinB